MRWTKEEWIKLIMIWPFFPICTLDHLDYHGTMEHYGLSKRRLFQNLGKGEQKERGINGPLSTKTARGPRISWKAVQPMFFLMALRSVADLQGLRYSLGVKGDTDLNVTYQGKACPMFFAIRGTF